MPVTPMPRRTLLKLGAAAALSTATGPTSSPFPRPRTRPAAGPSEDDTARPSGDDAARPSGDDATGPPGDDAAQPSGNDATGPRRFYAGSYTTSGGPGLVTGLLDPLTGAPTVTASTAALVNPTWLAKPVPPRDDSPGAARHELVYAVSEQEHGTVSALAPDLAVLGGVPTGRGPAHVAVHPGGGFLFVSLYGEGAVAVHPIDRDGLPQPASDLRRQGTADHPSHAHQVVIDPSGAFVLAVDLGRDAVVTYTLDEAGGQLTEIAHTVLAPGSGPRHLAFHPSGTAAYVAGERDSTVTVCAWTNGILTPVQVLPAAPATGIANRPAEITVSPDGAHVYVSNRGTDTIAVFTTEATNAAETTSAAETTNAMETTSAAEATSAEEAASAAETASGTRETGATSGMRATGATSGTRATGAPAEPRLTRIAAPPSGGNHPRHLALDPAAGRLYVANQRSGTLTWHHLADGIPGPAAGALALPAVAHILL